jgi:hypothetical protein
MSVEPGYLTVTDLIDRGWTRSLIAKHLGPPDELFPVDHWLNWSEKNAWHIQTVELVEMTQGFEASFLHGAKIRRLPKDKTEAVIDRIYNLREGRGLTPDQIQSEYESHLRAVCNSAADLISEARRRGYRTPHKC